MPTRQVKRMMKPVWAGFDRFATRLPGVTVLLYHRVGAGTDSEVDLPIDLFAQQMFELSIAGNVVSLDTAIATLNGQAPPPKGQTVVITFDDGTADFVEHAVPVLVHHNLPATLYVATRYVEDGESFWPNSKVLSWNALDEAVSTGLITIASHTHTHALLDRLPAQRIGEELDRSIDLIGDRLGLRASHFAYPKALPPSSAADTEVRRRFTSAALAGTRANPYARTDPHRLRRSPVQRSDAMKWWRRKVAGGLGLEDRVRDVANVVRYVGAQR